jgi:hypothetical protein
VELPEEEKHLTLALTWRRGRVVVEGTLCATPSTPIFIASLFSLHSVATCVFQDKSSTDKYTTATQKKKGKEILLVVAGFFPVMGQA